MKRILYLHGFASGPGSSKARYFREHLERLGAAVEVPDLAAGKFEYLTLSAQLAVVEQCAQGQPVSLIGSSLGGYLAALYAARHPEVGRLVLLAPAFGFARLWADYLGTARIEMWRSTGSLPVFHYGESRMKTVRYELLEDAARFEDDPGFQQSALIFHGANDDVVPAAVSRRFVAAHPRVRLEVLDSGHDLLNVLEYITGQASDFLLASGE